MEKQKVAAATIHSKSPIMIKWQDKMARAAAGESLTAGL
jgi:hypothetical protein